MFGCVLEQQVTHIYTGRVAVLRPQIPQGSSYDPHALPGRVTKRVGDGLGLRVRPQAELPRRGRAYSRLPVGMDRAGVVLVQPALGVDVALIQPELQPD